MEKREVEKINKMFAKFIDSFEACETVAKKVELFQETARLCRRNPHKYAALKAYAMYKRVDEPTSALYKNMEFALTLVLMKFTPDQAFACMTTSDNYIKALKELKEAELS